MWTRWLLAGVVAATSAVPALAADLAGDAGYGRPYRQVAVLRPVEIVPDCREIDPIVLGCAPRVAPPVGPALVDAQRQYIELGQTVRPYQQLFTWTR